MQLNKIIILSFALFSNAFAADIEPAGTVDYIFKPTGHAQFAAPKKIKLLNFKLSSKAIEALKLKAHAIHQTPALLAIPPQMPKEKQLGMNGVPVLDQGGFGTCVTFADTAAVDAALGKGDYISQLCLLQLGNYFRENAYGFTGWDGSLNRVVLNRLEEHGFVSKEKEQTEGCGGLTEYPHDSTVIPHSAISFDDYHKLSESLTTNHIYWSTILDSYKTLLYDNADTQNTISEIKKALDTEQRVTMGVWLPASDLGLAGAVGKHHAENDTWVLSSVIERELYLSRSPFFPGHAMVITGYDDNATAIDDLGREHTGLFTLRNSWGEQVGDQGDFYMSYDYFRVLGFEADQVVRDTFDDHDSSDEPDDDDGEED